MKAETTVSSLSDTELPEKETRSAISTGSAGSPGAGSMGCSPAITGELVGS